MSLSFISKPVRSVLTSLSAEKKPDEKFSHIKNCENVSVKINTYRSINPKTVQKALKELSVQYSKSNPNLSIAFKKASNPNARKLQEMINYLDELEPSKLTDQLVTALGKSNTKAAELLLYSGANPNFLVNVNDSEFTILIATIQYGRKGWKELIRYGADVNYQRGENEETPLTIAIKNGNPAIVTTLLQNKANPNKPSKGLTPLHHCLEKAKVASETSVSFYAQMIQQLVKYGARLDALNKNRENPIQVANKLSSTKDCLKYYFRQIQSALENAQSEKITRELEEGRYFKIESKEGKYS